MKGAVFIILRNENKEILLQLRDDDLDIYYPGYWGLIGGTINKGEIALNAIRREIQEEINVNVENIKLIHKGNHLRLRIFIYKGQIKEKAEDIILTEGQKVEYFKFDDIKRLHLVPFQKKFILKNKDKILC